MRNTLIPNSKTLKIFKILSFSSINRLSNNYQKNYKIIQIIVIFINNHILLIFFNQLYIFMFTLFFN